jgi:hypothetical protein
MEAKTNNREEWLVSVVKKAKFPRRQHNQGIRKQYDTANIHKIQRQSRVRRNKNCGDEKLLKNRLNLWSGKPLFRMVLFVAFFSPLYWHITFKNITTVFFHIVTNLLFMSTFMDATAL